MTKEYIVAGLGAYDKTSKGFQKDDKDALLTFRDSNYDFYDFYLSQEQTIELRNQLNAVIAANEKSVPKLNINI